MVAAKSILAILGFASSGLAYTVPRDFPKIVQRGVFKENTTNGFPNKTSTNADLQIAMEAGGKLPQGPLPTNLSDAAITAWQLIAFNEIFEVAFFSAVNYNLTHNVKGFDLNSTLKSDAQKIVNAVRAQEQQHALGALAVLKENKAFQPSACEYNVPSDNLTTSIALANTITDVVLGVLTGANMVFANDSSIPSVEIISSVIGQEGEQNGAYRGLLGRIPSSAPFLTPVPPAFAWSALQLFVVPGSCGFNLDRINLTIFPPLSVNGSAIAVVPPTDTPLSFEADLSNYTMTNDQSPKLNDYINKTSGLYATFTSGLQYPVSVEAKNVKWSGKTVSFDAEFPYNETVAGGFSHAALTTEKNITSFLEVPNYALTGPAVIQANVTY